MIYSRNTSASPRTHLAHECILDCQRPRWRAFKRFQKGVSMAQGTVKWFNSEKGYGFIAPDGGGQDAFVHISAVERSGLNTLREGDKISFELVADRKSGKMSAEKLEIVL
jgi:CspA family cold shock protein